MVYQRWTFYPSYSYIVQLINDKLRERNVVRVISS